MSKLIYYSILGTVVFAFIMAGCASSPRRSDLGVLKMETRTDLGKYKSDK